MMAAQQVRSPRFAPGPWSHGDVWPDVEANEWASSICGPEGFVADITQALSVSRDEAFANLLLMNAATDLYWALVAFIDPDPDRSTDDVIRAAHNAVNKALGQ